MSDLTASAYYAHPSIEAIARVLVERRIVTEGGTRLLRRCARVRLAIVGGHGDHERVGKVLRQEGLGEGDAISVHEVIAAVRASVKPTDPTPATLNPGLTVAPVGITADSGDHS